MADSDTTTTDGLITIDYMDETTNQRHVQKHTTARTVGEFKEKERLSNSVSISVEDILADDNTPLTDGCEVTVVSGNKTGGTTTRTRKRVKTAKAGDIIIGRRGFNATLHTNGILHAQKKVHTIFKGRKMTHTVIEGLEMPERSVSTRGTKYPFHVLEVGQCYTQPLTKQVRVNTTAAIRNFMNLHPSILLQARTFMLGNEPVFGVWRSR